MAKQINVGVGGAVKKVSKVYASVGGAVKEIKKGVAGVGGAVKEFFTSNLITSLSRSAKCWITAQYGNYLYIQSNESSDEESIYAYAYVYGDFSEKSYSFDVSPSDTTVYIQIYGPSTSGGSVVQKSELSFSSSTHTRTGTFPTGCPYFRFQTGANREDSGGINVHSVVIDGTEYIDYLRTASWPQA